MPSAIEIRAARVDDADGISRVHVDGWRATYRGYMPDSVLDGLDYTERAARWRQNLERPAAQTFVAVETRDGAETVLGFASICPVRDEDAPAGTGEVRAIYVAPERYRHGIGSQLMARLVREAQTANFVRLSLWVGAKNERAMAFYRARGFEADGAAKVDTSLVGAPLDERRFVAVL